MRISQAKGNKKFPKRNAQNGFAYSSAFLVKIDFGDTQKQAVMEDFHYSLFQRGDKVKILMALPSNTHKGLVNHFCFAKAAFGVCPILGSDEVSTLLSKAVLRTDGTSLPLHP